MPDQFPVHPFFGWPEVWKDTGGSGYSPGMTLIVSGGTGAFKTALAASGTTGQHILGVGPQVFDGQNWFPIVAVPIGNGQNAQGVSQATFGSGEDPGNGLIRVGYKGGGWSVKSNPGSGALASASQPAQGGTVRNVLRSFDFGIATGGTAPPLRALTVSLRDGATGAGTILRQWTIVVPTSLAYDYSFGLSNLWIEGSQNTAMTLEMDVADANTFQWCNIEGVLAAN